MWGRRGGVVLAIVIAAGAVVGAAPLQVFIFLSFFACMHVLAYILGQECICYLCDLGGQCSIRSVCVCVCVCFGGGVACAHVVVPAHAQDDFIIAVPTHGHIFYDPKKVCVY